MDDLHQLLHRVADLDDRLSRVRERRGRPGVGVFQVFNAGAMPSGGLKFSACHPVEIGGTGGEGQTGSYTVGTATVPVAVLDETPAVGDYLIAQAVPDGRWVAARRGAGGGNYGTGWPSGCACPNTPDTLHLNLSGTCFEGTFQAADFS